MRMSTLFGQTLKEAPADADIASHQLLVRAGYVRQLGTGIFSYLPLAHRVLARISHILREEINAIGGQEISMPVVHPADIWKATHRWYQIDATLTRFKDRAGRDMALAMTHEEVIGDLVRREISSYRQLPLLLYQLQTKWRDEPRPRAGLIRTREFIMKDSYSLDADWEGLDKQYRAHYQAYFNIYNRCGLPVIATRSDVGMMGGSMAHEFMYLTPIGEDTVFTCPQCGYSANREVARFRKSPAEREDLLPIEQVATPNTRTIDALARWLDVSNSRTAKALFLVATLSEGQGEATAYRDRLVIALVRGDMDANETKLMNCIQAKALRSANEEEITAVGVVPGYGSPIGASSDALVVVDDSVADSPNLVMGANVAGYHLKNVNLGRDYAADIVSDIAAAQEGNSCPTCGKPLAMARGVEVGNIFKLGTRYSDAMGCTFLDKGGKAKPVIMGSYGIGLGRLLACIAEAHHDEYGLIWPITVAPYHVHLISLKGGRDSAEQLYASMQAEGIEVLYDDREESPGVKFKDADLIGVPLRVTASERSLKAGGVELKLRSDDQHTLVPLGEALGTFWNEIRKLEARVAERVGPVSIAPED